MMEDDNEIHRVLGRVKWFDPVKGFGFVVADTGGPDILLHANVLRNYGQGSVADGVGISLSIQETARGVQAIEVHGIDISAVEDTSVVSEIGELDDISDADIAFEPARVKWFDKSKGFGFANVFGSNEDVFVHVEVLQRSGFADLQPGEAIGLKVVVGKRGHMASSVIAWDSALK